MQLHSSVIVYQRLVFFSSTLIKRIFRIEIGKIRSNCDVLLVLRLNVGADFGALFAQVGLNSPPV